MSVEHEGNFLSFKAWAILAIVIAVVVVIWNPDFGEAGFGRGFGGRIKNGLVAGGLGSLVLGYYLKKINRKLGPPR